MLVHVRCVYIRHITVITVYSTMDRVKEIIKPIKDQILPTTEQTSVGLDQGEHAQADKGFKPVTASNMQTTDSDSLAKRVTDDKAVPDDRSHVKASDPPQKE
eukprot:jgi/Chrzof1/7577/Cz02g28300.t1